MALITGLLVGEEVLKDVIIPWWIASEAVAIGSAVTGSVVAVAVEESKDPVVDVSQQMEQMQIDVRSDVELDDQQYRDLDEEIQQIQIDVRSDVDLDEVDYMEIDQEIQQIPWEMPREQGQQDRSTGLNPQQRLPDGGGGNDPNPRRDGDPIQIDPIRTVDSAIGKIFPGKKPQEKKEEKTEKTETPKETKTETKTIILKPKQSEKVDPNNIFTQTLSQRIKLNTRRLE